RRRGRLEFRVDDRQRPRSAVIRRWTTGVMFCPDEIREDVVVTPAVTAVLVAPGVVIELVAANVDHGVDRRRAADHPAARPVHLLACGFLLRNGAESPVVGALEQ